VTAPAPRFGQVWEGSPEAIGPVRWLIVSSDVYNSVYGERRVIAAEIDSSAVLPGDLREPIVDAGTAHLDRLSWVTRGQMRTFVTMLHPSRHRDVARIIRNLIGN
jgi:hypothetical protein